MDSIPETVQEIYGTERHGLENNIGGRLDKMISDVFSNINDSMNL